MPRGDKDAYTDKQKRKAEHIEEGYEERGVPEEEAERRAWATVNKESGGGNKSGSGRGKPDTNGSRKKGGRKGGEARRPAARPSGRHPRRRRPRPGSGTPRSPGQPATASSQRSVRNSARSRPAGVRR